MPTTIQSALDTARTRLAGSGASTQLDAEVLLAHVLGQSRAYLRTWPERELNPEQSERFLRLLARRANGEPIAHLTGEREFWSLPIQVTPATLIPRPDTERLVELALERLADIGAPTLADLGTGSGAIALALASERTDARIVATDISADALTVARDNARRLGLKNVEFRQGNWCDAVRGERFDLIVSNPPYIRDEDPHLLIGDVRFEPRSALVSGEQGLADLRRIAERAQACLHPGGWLLLEHGYDQGTSAADLLRSLGYTDVETYRDAGGNDRVCAARTENIGRQ